MSAVSFNPPPAARPPLPAIAYVRMSTEHQQYSTENQLDRIRTFAADRGMVVERVLADEGKSGLSVRGRDQLQSLIREVESGAAPFKAILVYDVSRWGRFQDADESGYYEYICKRAGIAVHYCAEQFENDGSPASNIIKSVKRSMAGEYSRELSNKVFQGACRLIQLGFKQGGSAGYALRRMVLDAAGTPKGLLAYGEQKFLATDRVVFVPGPAAEQEIVREIFHAYINGGLCARQIAMELNRRGVPNSRGRRWTRLGIHDVLTNEKYIGNLVYYRRSYKLQQRSVPIPPDLWVRANGAFPAIVDPAVFTRAQELVRERAETYTEAELLAALRGLWSRCGRISAPLIDADANMPASSTFHYRFGSLLAAYQKIGYRCSHDQAFRTVSRHIRTQRRAVVDSLLATLASRGVSAAQDPVRGVIFIAGELAVSIVFVRCEQTRHRTWRWLLRTNATADLFVAVRLAEDNAAIKDYFIFPRFDRPTSVWLRSANHVSLEAYRFPDLSPLLNLADRILVEDAA